MQITALVLFALTAGTAGQISAVNADLQFAYRDPSIFCRPCNMFCTFGSQCVCGSCVPIGGGGGQICTNCGDSCTTSAGSFGHCNARLKCVNGVPNCGLSPTPQVCPMVKCVAPPPCDPPSVLKKNTMANGCPGCPQCVPPSGGCSADSDCPNGFCSAGRCMAYSGVGGPCGGFAPQLRQCKPGLTCKLGPFPDAPGTCVASTTGCSVDSDCRNGFCLNGRCIAYSGVGGPCGGFAPQLTQCKPGLTCQPPSFPTPPDAPGTCVASPSGCSVDSDCRNGFCLNGKCIAYSGVNGPCGGFAPQLTQCKPGLTCKLPDYPDAMGYCVASNSGDCSVDSDCRNGFCLNGGCNTYSGIGGPCGGFAPQLRQCKPGLTCKLPDYPDGIGYCVASSTNCPPCPMLYCPPYLQVTADVSGTDASASLDASLAIADFSARRCPPCPTCGGGGNLPCCFSQAQQSACRDCGFGG